MDKRDELAGFIEPHHLAANALSLRAASPTVAQLLTCPATKVIVVIKHSRSQLTPTHTVSKLAFVEYLPYYGTGNIFRFWHRYGLS